MMAKPLSCSDLSLELLAKSKTTIMLLLKLHGSTSLPFYIMKIFSFFATGINHRLVGGVLTFLSQPLKIHSCITGCFD